MAGPIYSTTKAARSLMPKVIQVLESIVDDETEGGIARVQAADKLMKLAKLDQVAEPVDNVVNLIATGSENVVPINAGQSLSNAATN